jgi:hypothetical protein
MMEGDWIVNGTTKKSRCEMVKWLVNLYEHIPEEIGRNAWRKKGLKWLYLLFILNN